ELNLKPQFWGMNIGNEVQKKCPTAHGVLHRAEPSGTWNVASHRAIHRNQLCITQQVSSG
ncbi:hypothetical protein HAX54_045176, partial [Datura stramonium]|nr:hypothetical protein [Datura stramonium]